MAAQPVTGTERGWEKKFNHGWTVMWEINKLAAMTPNYGMGESFSINTGRIRKPWVVQVGLILSIPTCIMGLLMLIDICGLSSVSETGTVADKYVMHGRHNSTSYGIKVSGIHHYSKTVGYSFYHLCTVGDTVELSVSPIFREWHRVTLLRGDGSAAGSTIPSIIYLLEGFGFWSFLSLLIWYEPFRDYLVDSYREAPKGVGVNLLIWLVAVPEIWAVYLWLKFACVGAGWVGSM